MAKLGDIISAFLDDLTLAQHQANQLSKRLSKKYCTHPLLRFFPVPNALIDEVDLELRFVVTEKQIEPEGKSQESPDICPVPPPPAPIGALEKNLAGLVAEGLIHELKKAKVAEDQAEIKQRLIASLRTDATRQGLGDHLYPVCRDIVAKELNPYPPEGKARRDPDETLESLKAAIANSLKDDNDLKKVISDISSAVDQVITERKDEINEMIEHFSKELRKLESDDNGILSLDVNCDANVLEQFPEYAVQSFKIKVKLRNYKWVTVNEKENELIPEN